eukprot:CAMPEP_0115161464 /NCGR_PEP_ID=MMETSP0227-20121206/71352_1 /TAXON_ID=89957 /ORGANISM="Polarella glacialis, Strain CCMP 1383" /LENGTH=977 /DNA_ID=CAMNT_0002573429 /DNA_START=73 /DNA_END=3006 /DNA_ORIENTATION=-
MTAGLQNAAMISSGELYLLNGTTGGELQPLPFFLNKNFRVLSANLDCAYIAVEPPVCPPEYERPPCSVYCFNGTTSEPELCQEFEELQAPIRQIANGANHVLVLTEDGTLYSRGTAVYGSTGHGGARNVPDFRPVPALQGKKVKFVACGGNFSIAITFEGDVYSWGRSFQGETGLFSKVETVPRFAPEVTPYRVVEVSCGDGHVLARTESQQCIAWGENTCGQLGLGMKSKPTYKPQLLDSIPSQVASVSAGWAHSVAVGTDGRVYTWGLNSHGQLGLGDTKTRLAPHLLHGLIDLHQVESAHAARSLTILRTSSQKALFCGQIPRDPSGAPMDFAPRRPGNRDPDGCILAPVALNLSKGDNLGSSPAQLSDIVAFDRGAIGYARSTVYRVAPNVAPVGGGTKIRAMVTGLPFDTSKPMQSTMSSMLVQDAIPCQVRLKSMSPICDMIVKGRIIAKDTVEFLAPDAGPSPLGAVVEQGNTLPVQIRVSIDNGFTWTPDRFAAPDPKEIDTTLMRSQSNLSYQNGGAGGKDMAKSLKSFRGDFEVKRATDKVSDMGSTMLWLSMWPQDGPSHAEPRCAPVTGGTEILVHVNLPARMPTDNLTVKFVCTPLKSIGDAELEGRAPMKRDAAEIVNPCSEAVARLALAGALEVPVVAWLDPSGRGVRCVSPPMDSDCVQFYEYSVQLSLDGNNYLERELPFQIYDLRVTGLEPNLGSLVQTSQVRIKTMGQVSTDILKVRLDFPKDLWASRTLPAFIDHTTGEIFFTMPELEAEVRQRSEEVAALAQASSDGDEAGAPAEDPDGGLAGLEVFVELSLNGQNFTEDRIRFTYHGGIQPDVVKALAGPDGKAKEEAHDSGDSSAHAGSKLGVITKGLPGQDPATLTFCALRAEMVSGEGEAAEVVKVVDMEAHVEAVPGAGEDAEPVYMVVALAPSVRAQDVPEGAPLFLRHFQVALNGQCFTACSEQAPMKLEPVPASAGEP